MPTRFFFPETEAAAVSPTISGADWEHINTLRRKLLATADASALTTTAYTPDAADHLVNGDAHHRQYVSDAIAAQTISGNVKAQFQCLEANNGNNLFLTLLIYVVSNDGTTVTGTLLAITRDTTNELGTALNNRNFPSTALSSVVANANDRIVVEVGLGGTPTASGGVQGHNGSLRFGGNASSGDLPEDDTTTATTYRPWLEFDGTISFPGVTYQITLAATALGVATLSRAATFPKTLAATAVGVSGLSLARLTALTLPAVAVGIATMTTVTTFVRTLATVAVGVATLVKVFIAGEGGGARPDWSMFYPWRRRSRR